MSKERDMTVGRPLPILLSFILPLLLGLLFQQFYSMVDTVVVGKSLGVEALAGVGSTGSISFLIIGLCTGICSGFAIPVAQKFGERDEDGLRRFVGNMVWLGSLIALVMTLLTTLGCRWILTAMNTPEDTFSYAYDYIFLIFLGIPATMLYNTLSGILRSLGDSRTPLLFLIFSSLLNVALDLLFVVTLQMGAAGAGWATLISQLISGLLCLVYMAKKFPILRLSRDDLKARKLYAVRLLFMGLPMGLQYRITAIGTILLQTAVNGLGAAAMAATTASSKVTGLFAVPFDAIGATDKLDRVNAGVKTCALLGSIYSVVALIVLYFGAAPLSGLFLNSDEAAAAGQILPMARQLLVINAAFYIPLLFVNLLRFTIQGLGYSNLAVIAGVSEMVARGIVALGLVPVLGFTGVCYASPAAWVMADCFLFPAYFYGVKKRKAQYAPRAARAGTL